MFNSDKSILDYASNKEKESYDISEDNQKLVMERFEEIKNSPERLLDWDKAKKSLRTKKTGNQLLD